MSNLWVLTGLIKIDNLEHNVKKLLLSTNDLPEMSIKKPEWMTISDVEDFIREAKYSSIDNLQNYSVTLQFGEAITGRPLLEQNWIDLTLNPKPQLRLKDTFIFQIEIPTSVGRSHFSSRGSWSNIENILDILNPYFAFSSDYANTIAGAIDLDNKNILEKPWELYWNTVIYSKSLAENIDVKDDDFKNNIYYYRILKNSCIWISSPYGLGNESPYQFDSIDNHGNLKTITDSKIEMFVRSSVRAHQKHLSDLMQLKI